MRISTAAGRPRQEKKQAELRIRGAAQGTRIRMPACMRIVVRVRENPARRGVKDGQPRGKLRAQIPIIGWSMIWR